MTAKLSITKVEPNTSDFGIESSHVILNEVTGELYTRTLNNQIKRVGADTAFTPSGNGLTSSSASNVSAALTALDASGCPARDGPLQVAHGRGWAATTAKRLILCGVDSLTDGAGSSTWRTSFMAAVRASRGYGGPGYNPFRNAGEYTAFSHSSGVVEVTIDDGLYGQYALGGSGQYVASGAGADTFSWTPSGDWDTAVIYYLVQPGGGTFTILPSPGVASTSVNTVGTLALGSVTIKNVEGGLTFGSITGNVCIFGANFLKNNSYPVFGNLGVGGVKLSSWAGQNAAFIQSFIAALTPSDFFIDAGMNDRLTRTAAQHLTDLTTVVTNIQTGYASCRVALITSNEPSDAASSNWGAYVAQKIAVANTKDCDYFDTRNALGTYAQANANSFMTDAIHPNATGNKIKGIYLANMKGFGDGTGDPGVTSVTPTNPTKGSLTTKQLTIAAGVATTVWSVGLDRNFTAAALKVQVVAGRTGTGSVFINDHWMALFGPSGGYGLVSSVSAITPTNLLTVNAGDGFHNAYTLTIAVVSSVAVIKVTASSYDGLFTCSAEWTDVNPGGSSITGHTVYEL